MELKEGQSVFAQAVWFAAEAHCNSARKGTDTPYIIHPMEAAVISATMTSDPYVLAAAILHDVVEDTMAETEDIERAFGPRVAKIVSALSENKRPEQPPQETWLQRKREFVAYLENDSALEEKIVALGDKLSNMRSIEREYRKLGDGLWERFNQKDKSQHGWYYTSVCRALSELENTDAWKELSSLVDTVFGASSED